MALKNKLLKNIGWMLGGRIFQMVISLAISVVTARYLGPENYGILGYVGSFISFFYALSVLGLDGIIVKELLLHEKEQGKIVGTAMGMRLAVGVVSMAVLQGLIYLLHPEDQTMQLVMFFASSALLFHIFDTISYFFQSKLESKVVTILSTIAYLCMVVFKIIILILEKSVEWFALASTLYLVFLAILLAFAYGKHGGQRIQFSLTTAKRLLSQSYHFIIAAVMVAVYAQTDKIMIGQFLNQTEVGYYSTAVTINALWAFIPMAIIDSARPIIVETKEKDELLFAKRTKQLYAALIWLSLFVGVVLTFSSGLVVSVLYGESYMPAATVLSIIVWYSSFTYLGTAKNIWLVCQGKQRYEKWFTLFGALTNIALNLVFIPMFGIVGAAVATLLTQLLTNFVYPLIPRETRQSSQLIIEGFLLKGVLSKSLVKQILTKIKNKI